MDLSAVRAELPVLERYAYLNAGTNGPLPRRTAAAISRALERDLSEGRSSKAYFESLLSGREQLRAALADFLGTGAENIALARSTTEGCNIVIAGLGIGPGDEVLVPTLTYVASVNAIRYVGATPVFVDSLRDTWQMDPDAARRRVTSRTRAVLAVHLYGGACAMPELRALCAGAGLRLVEDCAEGIGTRHGGRHVGGLGDVGTFSFFGNKTITTGEGGMLTCADPELAENIRRLRGQGLVPGLEYWHDRVGYNYRMTNVAAALGLAQLERLPSLLARKRAIAEHYDRAFRNVPGISLAPRTAFAAPSFWLYSISVDRAAFGVTRDALIERLAGAGIEARAVWPPLHGMPAYAGYPRLGGPISESIAARALSLPSSVSMTAAEQDRVIDVVCS